jgi:hypothetical protein
MGRASLLLQGCENPPSSTTSEGESRWQHNESSGVTLVTKENPNLQGVVIRSSRYLNNIVEQDHRAIKRRCAPMLSLKSFRTAAITLAGVELAHRIRKGQFSLRPGATPELSSFKHLWTRALKRRDASRLPRSDQPQPPMQQNSKIRIQSDQDIRNIAPVRYARKIAIGRSLYLNVTPTGGRSWYYKFYFEGKCQKLMLGTYPEISLQCAKSRHQYARNLLAQGINPCELKATLGKNAFVLRMRDWEITQHPPPEYSAFANSVPEGATHDGRSRSVGYSTPMRISE